jgi:glutamate--cysteine ligase
MVLAEYLGAGCYFGLCTHHTPVSRTWRIESRPREVLPKVEANPCRYEAMFVTMPRALFALCASSCLACGPRGGPDLANEARSCYNREEMWRPGSPCASPEKGLNPHPPMKPAPPAPSTSAASSGAAPIDVADPVGSLSELFSNSEKAASQWLVGMEAEKFGVYCGKSAPAGAPIEALTYDGDRGVVSIFDFLSTTYGYDIYRETEMGPAVALTRGGASITLEPSAQFELSGSPQSNLHMVFEEFREHYRELDAVTEKFGVRFLHLGFNPLHTLEQLPWVPKRRYPIMRDYLPRKGSRGLDMMQRTATVQVNLDYSSEDDAMSKVMTLLKLTPVIAGMTLNAPFIEGQVSQRKSERQDVWLHMDPARSGLIEELWNKPQPRYADYVNWATRAGMFLFYRDGEAILNTGQSFDAFLREGYQGQRATQADWELHLGTLFPQVRLKRTIEVRCCDCLPLDLSMALPALVVGLTYDSKAFGAAQELAQSISVESARAAQQALPVSGLQTTLADSTVLQYAERLIDIAGAGLQRRSRLDASGKDERQYLAGLSALLERGLTPADELLERFHASGLSVSQFVGQFCR